MIKKKTKKLSLFTERVLNIVSSIKRGQTMTYKEVAERAGSPGAARAVGSIMKANYKPGVPCHRVIRSDGIIGEYNRGGPREKYKKLKKEGAIK
jgi:O-6-methylguanine DNA methyltransferase